MLVFNLCISVGELLSTLYPFMLPMIVSFVIAEINMHKTNDGRVWPFLNNIKLKSICMAKQLTTYTETKVY